MRAQNTQDHVQTLKSTRALLPDVSYIFVRAVHLAHRPRREPALLTTASGGHISGEGRAEPEMEISLAAGITTRAAGHSEHGPAHVQAARAQHAQAGSDARALCGAPVK